MTDIYREEGFLNLPHFMSHFKSSVLCLMRTLVTPRLSSQEAFFNLRYLFMDSGDIQSILFTSLRGDKIIADYIMLSSNVISHAGTRWWVLWQGSV